MTVLSSIFAFARNQLDRLDGWVEHNQALYNAMRDDEKITALSAFSGAGVPVMTHTPNKAELEKRLTLSRETLPISFGNGS